MSDESLKHFLKDNAPNVPAEPLGESARIWRAIEVRKKRQTMWRIVPALVTATAAMLVFVVHTQVLRTEEKLEEEYLYQEWQAMMSEVNADESGLITTFGK